MTIPMRPVRLICRALFIVGGIATIALSLAPRDVIPDFNLWDKLLHAGGYLALAGVGAVGFRHSWRQIGIGLVLLGALLELGQAFVPGRFASLLDIVANLVGVCLGLAGFVLLTRLRAYALRRRFRFFPSG